MKKTLTNSTVAEELPASLVVRVPRACELLACSKPRLYRLLRAGEIASFRDGAVRKVELASLKSYVQRKIAEDRLRGR